jgi:capsular polysaccharide export protein
MNIAYLDPPYSRYFQRLAARLAQRTGGQVVALLSSPAYRLYSDGDRALVWPPGRAPAPLAPLPEGSSHATWSQTVDDDFLAVFWHAVAWFRARFQQERIELCLVFSDARPFSLAAAVAARELGVRCLYFERGAFRYATASLSTQGLNARFSIQRAQASTWIDGLPPDTPLDRRPIERGLRWHFVRFILASRLAAIVTPQRRLMQHKRYAFAPYLRLALSQWWTEHPVMRRDDAGLKLAAATPLVIVPLQLPGDSQLLLHSPFDNNQAFLDFVVDQARRVTPAVRVLVKRHPMDTRSYRLPPGADAVGGNLMRFAGLRPVVVCVNSTVGFEAACRGVQVLCFGESFYTDAGAAGAVAPCAPVALVSRADFAAALAARLHRPGDATGAVALRTAVLRWYQAPGDAWSFTDDDIARTADIALEHHHAEAALAAAALARPAADTLAGPAVTPIAAAAAIA